MDWAETIAFALSEIVFPLFAVSIGLLALYTFYSSQSFRIKAGNIEVSALNREVSEIRTRIDESATEPDPSARQFALLKEYHVQGLAQSKTSFWFSLLFAALGFSIILYSIVFYLGAEQSGNAETSIRSAPLDLSDAKKPIFALVAGTVVEAVAALFLFKAIKRVN